MSKILKVKARQVFDSRGNPTFRCTRCRTAGFDRPVVQPVRRAGAGQGHAQGGWVQRHLDPDH